MGSAQQLFTKMYESMQQAQSGPQAGGQASNGDGGDDDVVDAEYKEV